MLEVELSVLRDSERAVFSTGSWSFKPWAILTVDAIVSNSDGWSVHYTRSVFSSSPRCNNEALAALLDLAGTIWKDPLDEVTACLNSSYCAEDTFFAEPSSSSPSEKLVVFAVSSGWLAAKKRRVGSLTWRSWRMRWSGTWSTLWRSLNTVALSVTIPPACSLWSSNRRTWSVRDSAMSRTGRWWWRQSPNHHSGRWYSCRPGRRVLCVSLPLNHIHHAPGWRSWV